jgi:hypothetical protein
VSYILHNETSHVVSVELTLTFSTEGIPHWRVRQITRSHTQWVKIPPHGQVNLCDPPWNLTEQQANDQVSVKTFLVKGHLRRINDQGETIEPKPSVELSDVDQVHSLQPQESPYFPPESNNDSLTDQPLGEPGSDRFITLDDVIPPGSDRTLKPEEDTNPAVPKAKTMNCSEGVHHFPSDDKPCVGCGILKALICQCGFVGKNAQSIKAHKRTCKQASEEKK